MAKTADDQTFTRVAAVDEFRTDRGRMVYYQGTKVAVFRQGDSFFAVNDRCPHMGAAMSGGRITKGIIRCHMHGWEFDVTTGECKTKKWAKLPRYEVRIEGNDLLLRPILDEQKPNPDDDLDSFMKWDPSTADGGES
ncbi:MAG: Rieske (2Fe-2S) protein [Acidobacteria bacterium]|nr:Rieske (2Fe-2S) protein [Acidobacteriota bacterium]